MPTLLSGHDAAVGPIPSPYDPYFTLHLDEESSERDGLPVVCAFDQNNHAGWAEIRLADSEYWQIPSAVLPEFPKLVHTFRKLPPNPRYRCLEGPNYKTFEFHYPNQVIQYYRVL